MFNNWNNVQKILYTLPKLCRLFLQTYLREQVRELYNVFKNDTDDDRVPQNDHSLQ